MGVIERLQGLLKGGIRKLEAPARIAPDRRSEVAQGGFVTLRVLDKVWAGLRVGAIVDRRSVQAWSHPVGLNGSTRRTIKKASAFHGGYRRKTHDARIVDTVTYRIAGSYQLSPETTD